MNVEYMRTAKKSYMIVRQADYPFAPYELQMIRQNEIAALLPFQIILADGAAEYWYDASGMRSLETLFSVETFDAKRIRLLLENIMGLKSAMEEYLLDDANISFSADMIYYDQTREAIRFCYIPGIGAAGQGLPGMRELFEELLQHMNHADPIAVRMGYEMYERSARATFSMADCMDCLRIGENALAGSMEASARERDVMWQSGPGDAPDAQTDAESEDVEFLSDWPEQKEGHRKKRRQETQSWLGKTASVVREKRRDFGADKESTKRSEAGAEKEPAKRRLWFRGEKKEEENDLFFAMDAEPLERSEDSGKTEVIRTEDDAAEWKLTYKGNGIEQDLLPDGFPFLIGTDDQRVNGTLLARTVSRVHAKLFLKEDRLYVEDFNSTNGTYLNQQLLPMNTPTELKEGDRIVFATEEYEVFHRRTYGSAR